MSDKTLNDKHCMDYEMRNLTTEQYGNVLKTGECISKLISQIPTNFFIAGGAVIDFLKDRSYKINDIDMFFLSKKERDDTFKWLIRNGWKRQGGNKVRSYWIQTASNPVVLRQPFNEQITAYKLNIIHNIFKTIPECIDAFDINICSIACTKTGVIYAKNLGPKLIMIKNSEFCFNSSINASNIDAVIKRVYKYCRKDFKPMPSVVRQIIEVLYKDKDYKSDVYEGIEQKSNALYEAERRTRGEAGQPYGYVLQRLQPAQQQTVMLPF